MATEKKVGLVLLCHTKEQYREAQEVAFKFGHTWQGLGSKVRFLDANMPITLSLRFDQKNLGHGSTLGLSCYDNFIKVDLPSLLAEKVLR